MADRRDPQTPTAQGDRLLIALIAVASGTFIATVLWLLLGTR